MGKVVNIGISYNRLILEAIELHVIEFWTVWLHTIFAFLQRIKESEKHWRVTEATTKIFNSQGWPGWPSMNIHPWFIHVSFKAHGLPCRESFNNHVIVSMSHGWSWMILHEIEEFHENFVIFCHIVNCSSFAMERNTTQKNDRSFLFQLDDIENSDGVVNPAKSGRPKIT